MPIRFLKTALFACAIISGSLTAAELPISTMNCNFTKETLVGKSLNLISDFNVHNMRFQENHVSLVIGDKGGPLAAPIYKWDLSENKLTIIYTDGQRGYFEFISCKDSVVKVQNAIGTINEYQLN
ncbi:MAG: hypothetical protein RL171_1722 [Pseudomonadota bacterium]|jgi:hypothetical protein